MGISDKIRRNGRVKKFAHWLMIPSRQARPRKWVSWFINPFIHKIGKGAIIRYRTRMDVLPFNKFQIGDYSVVEDFCTINNGVGDVIIGSETLIGMGNVIIGPVWIGNNVIMAQNIVMSGLNHGYQDVTLAIHKQKVSTSFITIEDECWIGANVVVTAGVKIGKHCVIAAGTIVTKDIPAYSVAAGNPGRVIKNYDFERKEWVKTTGK